MPKLYTCLICGYKGLIQNPLNNDGEYQKTLISALVAILNTATVKIMK